MRLDGLRILQRTGARQKVRLVLAHDYEAVVPANIVTVFDQCRHRQPHFAGVGDSDFELPVAEWVSELLQILRRHLLDGY